MIPEADEPLVPAQDAAEGTRPGEVLGKEPVEQPGVAHPRGGGPALHQLEDVTFVVRGGHDRTSPVLAGWANSRTRAA